MLLILLYLWFKYVHRVLEYLTIYKFKLTTAVKQMALRMLANMMYGTMVSSDDFKSVLPAFIYAKKDCN